MDSAVLSKVRKLLAKAEATGVTPEEAQAFTAKAAELIARYGIDEALLTADNPGRDRVTNRRVLMDAPYAADKAVLLYKIAQALRCRGIVIKRGSVTQAVHLFGYAADLERVELLYTSLLLQATRDVVRARPERPRESVAAYRRSWLAGFTSAVFTRLQSIERHAQWEAEQTRPTGTGPSVELVLADRSTHVDQAFAEQYPRVSSGVMSRSGSGRADGFDAGRRADIGTTRVGGHSAAGSLTR